MPSNFFDKNQRAWLRTGRENKEPTGHNELSVRVGCIVILKTNESCIRVLLVNTKRFQKILDKHEVVHPGFFIADIGSPFGGLLKGKYLGNRISITTTDGYPLTNVLRMKAQIHKIIPPPKASQNRQRSGVEVWE
jgi:hypothetical protein